jgi:hypothetical protein
MFYEPLGVMEHSRQACSSQKALRCNCTPQMTSSRQIVYVRFRYFPGIGYVLSFANTSED